MGKLQTIEQQIMAEYGLVRGLIATNPITSVLVSLAVGAALMLAALKL